jgi:hypothetical protein
MSPRTENVRDTSEKRRDLGGYDHMICAHVHQFHARVELALTRVGCICNSVIGVS